MDYSNIIAIVSNSNGEFRSVGTGFFVRNSNEKFAKIIVTCYHVLKIIGCYNVGDLVGFMFEGGTTIRSAYVKSYDESIDVAILCSEGLQINGYCIFTEDISEISEIKFHTLGFPEGSLQGVVAHPVFERSTPDGLIELGNANAICQGFSGAPILDSLNRVYGIIRIVPKTLRKDGSMLFVAKAIVIGSVINTFLDIFCGDSKQYKIVSFINEDNSYNAWKRNLYSIQEQYILNMSAMPWMENRGIVFRHIIPEMLIDSVLKFKKSRNDSVSQDSFISYYDLSKNTAIIGGAGCGKSTLLYYLYLHCVKNETDSFINFFSDARWFKEYDGENVFEYIADKIGLADIPRFGNKQIRIFIDGLDEVSPETINKIIKLISRTMLNYVYIVACRDYVFSQNISRDKNKYGLFYEIVEVQSWSVDLSDKYVHMAFDKIAPTGINAESFINLFSNNIDFSEIYTNPFQLNVLLFIYCFREDTSSHKPSLGNLFNLYDDFVYTVYFNEYTRGTTTCKYYDFIEAMTTIAKEVFREVNSRTYGRKRQRGYEYRQLFNGPYRDIIENQSVISTLLFLDQSNDDIRFYHETIYEYFLAKSFLLAMQDSMISKVIDEFRNFYDFYINKFVRSGIVAYRENAADYYNALCTIYSLCIQNDVSLYTQFQLEVTDFRLTKFNGNELDGLTDKDVTTIRELAVYYTGRLDFSLQHVFPELLRFAYHNDPEPIIQRTAILGLMLNNDELTEREYINGLIPNSASDIMQRSLTLLYFGDDIGDIYRYSDSGTCGWEKSKRAIMDRLSIDNKRNFLYRLWDLRTLYLFCESRNDYSAITEDDYTVIKNCNINSELFSSEKIELLVSEKKRILTNWTKHSS